jgi:hypothetical protein
VLQVIRLQHLASMLVGRLLPEAQHTRQAGVSSYGSAGAGEGPVPVWSDRPRRQSWESAMRVEPSLQRPILRGRSARGEDSAVANPRRPLCAAGRRAHVHRHFLLRPIRRLPPPAVTVARVFGRQK